MRMVVLSVMIVIIIINIAFIFVIKHVEEGYGICGAVGRTLYAI
jgi:hypothetical protein